MPKTLASTCLRTLLTAVLLLLAAGTAQAAAAPVEPALDFGCGSSQQLAMTPLFAAAPAVAPQAAEQTPLLVETQACCKANCWYGPDVSCCVSGSCTAKDDPNGYVVCNGVYTYCPTESPRVCEEDDTRWVISGCCCDFSVPRQRQLEQLCVDGQWQYTGQSGCAGQCPTSCELW